MQDWSKDFGAVVKEFHFINLLTYLVYGRDKTFDMDSMRAFRSLKGYHFFADKFVRNVWTHSFPAHNGVRIVYVRGYVHHSMSCDPALTVYVAVNGETGDVYSAKCNCVAGLGEACNHVAALLFFMEDAAKKKIKKLPCELSKTSVAMKWNQPSKKHVDPSRLEDLSFAKACHGKKASGGDDGQDDQRIKRWMFDPRIPEQRSLSKPRLDVMVESFKGVQATLNSGLLQFWGSDEEIRLAAQQEQDDGELEALVLFTKEKAADVQPPADNPTPSLDDCIQFSEGMRLSSDLIQRVEEATRNQASCKLWHDLRNGRITSSRFSEIRRRRTGTNPENLVASLMGYKTDPQFLPAAIRWGRDNEVNARSAYEAYMKERGTEVEVSACGLHLDGDYSYLGASSDGKIVDSNLDTLCTGCLEIKCPFQLQGQSVLDLTPHEIAQRFPTKFCLSVGDDGSLHLKEGHAYYDQVMGEMAIIGVDWCDFVVFTPVGLFVERIVFDHDYWNTKLFPCLYEFFVRHMAPELITGHIWFSSNSEPSS